MKEKYIQDILRCRYFDRAVASVPNCVMVMNRFEADFLILQKSGYLTEMEIKTSRADYRADFKNKSEKHDILERGELIFKSATKGQDAYLSTNLPNRYVIVTPEGLLDPDDIPKYAGLMEVTKRHPWTRVVVKAPLIHKNKADPEILTRMVSSLSRRLWGPGKSWEYYT